VWKTREARDGSVLRERRCKARGCPTEFVTIELLRRALGARLSVAKRPRRKAEGPP
jgi:hypothetical protein